MKGLLLAFVAQASDVVVADFEAPTYGNWAVEGEAFGPGPARGPLPGQMDVSGFRGAGLVNTYWKGDDTLGVLTSPEFEVSRRHLHFLIGGGRHPGEACVNLLVDGKVARTATGGNSEHLRTVSWDVTDLAGRKARLELVDRRQGGWGHINADHFVLTDAPPRLPDERLELLAKAEASVKAAAEKVKGDPDRPVFHLLPPGNWMNDPNGPVYWKGRYHLFYQFNPYGDAWGHMHWGHWSSVDLVRWEHRPIALWPSKSLGEDHVFSGCAAVTGTGELRLFYTSIGSRAPEQWVASPMDEALDVWQKSPGNPILSEGHHGATKIHEWRDPFVFPYGGKTYLVCGGNLNGGKGGQGAVQVYRAGDAGLDAWTHLGSLFVHPDAAVKNIECPLFFPLGGKWVLIHSPHGRVEWFVGELDGASMRFVPKERGAMDVGHYYAPNAMEGPDGRRLLWGWVNGFPANRGWNGCMTLARVLSIGSDGRLRQEPAGEVEKLRRGPLAGDSFELSAELGEGGKLDLKGSTVSFDGKRLDVAGASIPIAAERVSLRAFFDRTVLEVYAGGQCATRVVKRSSDRVEAVGDARILESWSMRSIWEDGK